MLEQGGSWDNHLPLIEFTYNNSFHSSIRMAPYEAMYGRRCRTLLCWYESSESVVLGLEVVQARSFFWFEVYISTKFDSSGSLSIEV